MIVAIEGTSLTGKSTLVKGLKEQPEFADAITIPCYFECTADLRRWPAAVTYSENEQLRALRYFLELEGERLRLVQQAVADVPVLVDRSADTLLAHTHAIGKMQGFDARDSAEALVRGEGWIEPDITLLLVASPTTLAARAMGRPGFPSLYYDGTFVEHFNSHFDNTPLTPRCVTIDSESAIEVVVHQALEVLSSI